VTHILAIDQGTTSSRALLFDADMQVLRQSQREFTQHFPRSGWVEHDAEEIWDSTLATAKEAAGEAQIAAIGITNQRETTLVWDKTTGKAIHNAIVWQDRRTSDLCARLKEAGHEPMVTEKTGLLLDPYFSGTKIAWLLDNVEGARAKAEAGDLLFGTVDSFLIWRLTEGKAHVTDATNAARTMIYDIRKGQWSTTMLDLLGIPAAMMPEVLDSAAEFGTTTLLGGEVPILGVAGDQQAATVGQACFEPGMMKSTYGTGCFALLNTGEKPSFSKNRLLTTIAYQLDGKPTYALEGSIFIAGAVVQWLRDGLKIIGDARETQALAEAADENAELVLVPAFTGLGAPYWDSECRGAIYGLTRAAGRAEMAKAALESVGFQTRDLLEAMHKDYSASADTVLRVDGGMTASNWTMQFLSDILGAPVDRPEVLETTALGAAWLAGMKAGVYPGQEGFAATWKLDRQFKPAMDDATRDAKYTRWRDAVARTLSHQETR
jgi:glycerol kinase